MNGGRAASAGGRARRGHRAIAGASVVTAALAGVAAAVAAPASGVVAATAPGPQSQWLAPAAGAVVWIAAQPNAGAVGLDPVASQLTRDGSMVGFVTAWSGIDPGDALTDPDVFAYAVANGQTQRVNVTPGALTYGNGWLDSLSANGSIMSLTTASALAAADTNGQADVYVLDRGGNGLQRVSVGAGGEEPIGSAGPSSLSADGRVVAFAAILPGAIPGRTVWARDLATGVLQAASVASDGQPANGGAELGTLSDDGRYVSFWSTVTNLPTGAVVPGARNFYIRDRFGATTTHGLPAPGAPDSAVMSGDGNVVAYVLDASSDTSWPRLVHVWDRRAGIDRMLHIANPFNRVYDDWAVPIALSADGRYVLMEVPATPSARLAVAVTVYDTAADAIAFPAVDGTGAVVTSDTRIGGLSADGTKVLFTSSADGIVPGDANHDEDLFLARLDPSDFRPAPLGRGPFAGPVTATERAARIRP